MENPLDHMLQHTSAAARDYHVDDARVTAAQAAMPADRRTQLAQEAGWLSAHLVRIAETHHSECDREVCRTCDEIREALTVRLAMVRTFVDEQMTGSLSTPGLFRR